MIKNDIACISFNSLRTISKSKVKDAVKTQMISLSAEEKKEFLCKIEKPFAQYHWLIWTILFLLFMIGYTILKSNQITVVTAIGMILFILMGFAVLTIEASMAPEKMKFYRSIQKSKDSIYLLPLHIKSYRMEEHPCNRYSSIQYFATFDEIDGEYQVYFNYSHKELVEKGAKWQLYLILDMDYSWEGFLTYE